MNKEAILKQTQKTISEPIAEIILSAKSISNQEETLKLKVSPAMQSEEMWFSFYSIEFEDGEVLEASVAVGDNSLQSLTLALKGLLNLLETVESKNNLEFFYGNSQVTPQTIKETFIEPK